MTPPHGLSTLVVLLTACTLGVAHVTALAAATQTAAAQRVDTTSSTPAQPPPAAGTASSMRVPANRAMVPFTLAGQEIMRVFHAPSRLFTFEDTPRNLLGGRSLRIEQGYQKDGAGLGSVVWDGSMVMAHWLQRRGCALPLAGRRVLEVGAGTGIASVAAAMLGASVVVATDGDGAVLPLLSRNLGNNTGLGAPVVGPTAPAEATPAPAHDAGSQREGRPAAAPQVEVRRLVWGEAHRDLTLLRKAHPAGFDVILGADVVFEHDSAKTANRNITLIHAANTTFTGLVETLQQLAPRGSATRVLISHKRRYNREHTFHDMMNSHFTSKRVPRRQLHRDFRRSNLHLYVFTPRPASVEPADPANEPGKGRE